MEQKRKQLIAGLIPDATTQEVETFCSIVERTQLDPLARQIYAIKSSGGYKYLTSIDGLRLIAQRSKQYKGQSEVLWCGTDGIWVDVWLSSTPPVAAKVGVHRKGFKEPLVRTALFKEYNPNTSIWRKMPALMIAKVAEALALRTAFPEELSGLYTSDEMEQSIDTIPEIPKVSEVSVKTESLPEAKTYTLPKTTLPTEAQARYIRKLFSDIGKEFDDDEFKKVIDDLTVEEASKMIEELKQDKIKLDTLSDEEYEASKEVEELRQEDTKKTEEVKTPYKSAKLITEKQIKLIKVLLGEAYQDDTQAKQDFVKGVVLHDIDSVEELTVGEASEVITALKAVS